MQDKDSEILRNQRRRRKRIGKLKNGIMLTILGWLVLSMVLVIFLLVRTVSLEQKLDGLTQQLNELEADRKEAQEAADAAQGSTQITEGTEIPEENLTPPAAAGIADAENLAEEGDIHKVYLTFDDGPSENTGEILDILAEHDVKATFFVSGREDEESQELYRRIVEEGHTLGMHSYANKYNVIYQSRAAFEQDYRQLRDYLYEVTGVECRYYRFPGGSSNQVSNVPMSELIGFLNEQNTVYYDWNVSAGDAALAAFSPDEIIQNVTMDVDKYKTSVVLMHDSADSSATVEALGPLIEALRGSGAEILPIDEDTQVIQYVKADSIG